MGNIHTLETAFRARVSFEFGDSTVEEEEEKEYRLYLIRVYLLTLIFILIAFVHWYFVTINEDWQEFIRTNQNYLGYCFGYAILVYMMFASNAALRRVVLLDYLFAIIIVETLILCCCVFAAYSRWLLILISGIGIGVLFLLCIGGATYIEFDLTSMIPAIFVCCFILLGGGVFSLVLYLLTNIEWTLICFMAIIIIIMMLFVMVHTQCINGEGIISISYEDALLGSLTLFMDFIAMFSVIYIFTRVYNEQFRVKDKKE